ncbi:MAG: hypothetical protein EOO24_14270 [Comamonadaceae bacterium]|nr:MAG: hypothetical protein EOO24_14270 [Comamonadaceae bacterium]
MLGDLQILVSASRRRLALAACGVVLLSACGQKGPLFLPTGPEAAGRATLPETLSPSTTTTTPAAPAAATPATGRASPIRTP